MLYVSLFDAMDKINAWVNRYYPDSRMIDAKEACHLIRATMPKCDIVHCKDCKYYQYSRIFDKYWCAARDGFNEVEEDDFCSMGEEK